MNTLTYSDRGILLAILDDLKGGPPKQDSDLLVAAESWAKTLVPKFGFEHSLIRDVTILCRYLTQSSSDTDITDIARGALRYVLRRATDYPTDLGKLGLISDAFVASYSVYEIRTKLGEEAIYNPPRLTEGEKKEAESLFLEFIDKPFLRDEELPAQARLISSELGYLAGSGFFRRLQKNIDFLVGVLCDSRRTREDHSYARAALSYLVCEDDAIHDRLGIVGYLDDNFIAQLAVELIEPARNPWLDLLDAAVGCWPFLNWLNLDDGGGSRPVSEYLVINSALSCSSLRGKENPSVTVAIAPRTGPLPFLLGFVAALGVIQESRKGSVTEASFKLGQKVLIDGYATAEFLGVKVMYGRKMFILRQERVHQSHSVPVTNYWPIEDLHRLIPVDDSRTTRGRLIQDLSATNAPLPALEYLFYGAKMGELLSTAKRILVVTPVAMAYEMARHIHLYGHSLPNVIPMGHMTMEGTIESWSTRFGMLSPLLIFASDLDLACAYAEEEPTRNSLVVVDASGRNAKKIASLRQLQQLKLRVLVTLPQRGTAELSVTEDGSVDLWEWDPDDFSALLWPQQTPAGDRSGPIARYESGMQQQSVCVPDVKSISCPAADNAFEAVKLLKRLAMQRGEDHLTELDEIVATAARAMFRLLRSATPLRDESAFSIDIVQSITRLSEIRGKSLYLSAEERQAASRVELLLRRFYDELKENNPKAAVVRDALNGQQHLTLICPDPRMLPELVTAYGDERVRILRDHSDSEEEDLGGAIIAGWFGRERMAKFLIPPVAQPLILVLYDLETEWNKLFHRGCNQSRKNRSGYSSRARIFPTVRGWKEPSIGPAEDKGVEHDSSLQEMEAIREYVRNAYRQRVYSAAKSDGIEVEVPTRLVLFEGDAYAFLREQYKATVVTHLVDATVESAMEEPVDVKRRTVSKLKLGDALLFHQKSDRDVIRAVADRELGTGVRDAASLWRIALVNYAKQAGLTPTQLWERLKNGGCPLKYHTIKGWLEDDDMIAPRQYERDVRVVASVTADPQLNSRLDHVLVAIGEVFSAHQRASHMIAQQVLHRAVQILRYENQSRFIEIESGIVLVRVVEIDDATTQVRASIANRLQEGEQWPV